MQGNAESFQFNNLVISLAPGGGAGWTEKRTRPIARPSGVAILPRHSPAGGAVLLVEKRKPSSRPPIRGIVMRCWVVQSPAGLRHCHSCMMRVRRFLGANTAL